MPKPKRLRLSTGNEQVAIPNISTARCGIETISFLHRGLRATVELSGNDSIPFLQPEVTVNGSSANWSKAAWSHEDHWLPSFQLAEDGYDVSGWVFAPIQSRGFVYLMEIECGPSAPISLRAGWQGCWEKTCHATYTAKPMRGVRLASINQSLGMPYVEFHSHAPHFAVAFCPSELMEVEMFTDSSDGVKAGMTEDIVAHVGTAAGYSLTRGLEMQPGEKVRIALYVGIGLEEISSVASAAELKRRGYEDLLAATRSWLRERSLDVEDADLRDVLNLNMFYNYFFAQGMTLDAEEDVSVTSRTSQYHLATAYSDRDAMIWSLPAVLYIDHAQARKMLEYAFTVQIKNVGIHSRFIDGIVLEPGFELDGLCAPINALWRYVRATNDASIIFDRRIQAGINHIQGALASKRHREVSLFETSLLPSDDVAILPYVTYDNVLVWKMLRDLGQMYEHVGDLDRKDDVTERAAHVREAIMRHSIVEGPFGPMFAWSVDLNGNHRLYDNPQGSLQLLPYLEFCNPSLEQYVNTMNWIRSEHNPANVSISGGTPRRSMFAVANDLLAGDAEEALDILRHAPLDEGVCCEVIDRETGEAVSGQGYAACAGYVAFALATAMGIEPLRIVERRQPAAHAFRVGGRRRL